MVDIKLEKEELKIIRACISVARESIDNNVVMVTPREKELIENSDMDKIYMKFLG